MLLARLSCIHYWHTKHTLHAETDDAGGGGVRTMKKNGEMDEPKDTVRDPHDFFSDDVKILKIIRHQSDPMM